MTDPPDATSGAAGRGRDPAGDDGRSTGDERPAAGDDRSSAPAPAPGPEAAPGSDPMGDLASLMGAGDGGGLDLGALMEQASKMQQQLAEAQEEAAGQEITGAAGGGAVRITLTGAMEPTGVSIDPATIDPDDPGMLEDLVLAALRDGLAQVSELQSGALGGLDGGGPGGLLGDA